MVLRGAEPTADAAWAEFRGTAAEPLRAGVRRYSGWSEHADEPVRRWETPSGGMSLILSFGPTMRVASASAPRPSTVSSFLVGMYDEPALTEHDGVGFGVQIDLTSAGAYALVGGSMGELENRVVPVDDVCSRVDIDRVVDRMLATYDPAARGRILDEELGRAIARGPCLSPEIAWVDRQLRRRSGVRIGALAAELGWSGGRLVEVFRREVGITPKRLARVLRFGAARDALGASARRSLAEVAADCGYADQAHFTREFRAFSGRTPTEYLTDLRAP